MIKGKSEITLEPGKHRVSYLCPTNVLMSVNDRPMAILKGSSKTTLTVRTETKISLDPVGKEPYTFQASLMAPLSEDTDDVPPPQPAPPTNYLQAVRERVRASMGIIREEFADNRTVYEVFDDLDQFEEERDLARQSATSEPEPEPATPEPVAEETENTQASE